MRPRTMRARTSEVVEAQRLVGHFLRAAQEYCRRFRPAHRHGDVIGFGERGIGGGVVRIELDRAPEQRARLHVVCARRALQCRPGAQHVDRRLRDSRSAWRTPGVARLWSRGSPRPRRSAVVILSCKAKTSASASSKRTDQSTRPSVSTSWAVNPHAVAGVADAAFDLIAHRKAAADLSGARGLALVREDGVPRHDRQRGKPAQRVDDVLRQPIREIVASRIVALVQEGENGDRRFGAELGAFRRLIAGTHSAANWSTASLQQAATTTPGQRMKLLRQSVSAVLNSVRAWSRIVDSEDRTPSSGAGEPGVPIGRGRISRRNDRHGRFKSIAAAGDRS